MMSRIREIFVETVTDTVRELFIAANRELSRDVLEALARAAEEEVSPLGRYALEKILENTEVARDDNMPLCQDTGLAVVFVEMGQDVHIVGGDFNEAVQEGVRQAYRDGYLRKSLCDPLSRRNTGDNTPAVIFTELVPGDQLKLSAMPKGGGSENMSGSVMLTPAVGEAGIRAHVVDCVRRAGSNPCPPVVVGVGIGGSLEMSAVLAKKALLRPLGTANVRDERLAAMERELLTEINRLGIGPQGYGGRVTALAVHVEMMPCHIASLPVTVNIQCHVARHREAVI
ncbi:fumarate hydratase [Syntrophus aciditrophicus]|uniref:Fumarate hydratase alpha subunit n=1 Tax=Syntrophus aciditrophicus (strain SB) TaxID=56780 RepID=Q2LYF4_SYNAS|nr:fumarate hydratase [Syntrophus aciditrophicus]ABC75960.1 fumarate hydratase alpha subunit [Syntrophus aciditrophicus SB]